MRIGFDNPVMPVIKPVLLGLFIFTFPALVSGSLLAKNYRNEARPVRWWSSHPFLWLAAIGLSAGFGRLAGATGLNAFPVIAVYSTPTLNWKLEASRVASAWMEGPPAMATLSTTDMATQGIQSLTAVAS